MAMFFQNTGLKVFNIGISFLNTIRFPAPQSQKVTEA